MKRIKTASWHARCIIFALLGCIFLACGSSGDAEKAPGVSGDKCTTATACADGFFCSFPKGDCGEGEASGECQPAGEICPEIFQPVCACDGKTYSNDCFAGAASQSVRRDGRCEDTPAK